MLGCSTFASPPITVTATRSAIREKGGIPRAMQTSVGARIISGRLKSRSRQSEGKAGTRPQREPTRRKSGNGSRYGDRRLGVRGYRSSVEWMRVVKHAKVGAKEDKKSDGQIRVQGKDKDERGA